MSRPRVETASGGARASLAPTQRGWARRLLGPLYFSGAAWYRIHFWAARNLPEWAIRIAVPAFATGFFCFLGGVRRALASNGQAVAEATGQGSWSWLRGQRHAFRTVLNHAWCMTETYEGLAGRSGVEPEVEGVEHWDAVLGDGRGAVLVTAHVGHWEVGSHVAGRQSAGKVHVVREPELDPQAQEFVADLLARVGGERYQVHFASESDPALGARLLGALRRGDVVALQGDRPRRGGRAVQVPLLGRPYRVPLGPLALARAAGVPLLPVFALRTGRRRSRLIFRPPIGFEDPRGRVASRRLETLEAGAARLASEVEGVLLRAPEQWFCFRELWPARDAGAQTTASPAG